MLCLNGFNGLGQLGLRILDHMSLIQNAVEPVNIFQARDVVANNFVRRDDNVFGSQLREDPRTLFRIPSVENGPEVIGILEDLIVPVTSQSRRANDQGW